MDNKAKEEKPNKKYKKQKIDTYVSVEDLKRLTIICEKYGFRSIYQLLQYLVHCFLRVADPESDKTNEPLPHEIKEMFTNNTEWEQHNQTFGSHKDMVKKCKPDQRKVKTANDL